ncbi:MAG: MFS transporter, partial [Cellulosimicrobium cellulans]
MAPPPPTSATVSQPVIDSASAVSATSASPQTQPVGVVSEHLPWRQTFISLKVPNFRIFAIGHFVAVVALWMQRIAQDWLVLEL